MPYHNKDPKRDHNFDNHPHRPDTGKALSDQRASPESWRIRQKADLEGGSHKIRVPFIKGSARGLGLESLKGVPIKYPLPV